MSYVRPQNLRKLDKTEKNALLKEYIAYYEKAVQEQGVEALNTKISREVFAPVLDMLGELIQEYADRILKDSKDIQEFLQSNPLPAQMSNMLPDNFRVFSLLLNALKQWVSAESAATDRFLLGGTARQSCREAVKHCIVTGEKLSDDAELHHPVRDGRPPILLSKKGHAIVEQAVADLGISRVRATDGELTKEQNELWQKLQSLRSERNQSWRQLREGCTALLNLGATCRPGAKSFANIVIRETGKSPKEIIQLLDCIGR